MKSLVIYCDESIKRGQYFSNFYGGALVNEIDINYVINELRKAKMETELKGELKWTNMSSLVLDKYKIFIDKFFDLIEEDKLKVRIMFKKESFKTIGLTLEQEEQEFYILYYQFLKNIFGLEYCNPTNEEVKLKVFFDKLPNKKCENERFKKYIRNLENTPNFKKANIRINKEDIADVDSKKHLILQGVDIVLGAIKFKLNDEHKIKPLGSRTRGKKTIAKEKLYKHIHQRIIKLYPHFNIGISTGMKSDNTNKWNHKYRHWNFISKEYEIDESKIKNKSPISST
ncbi:DUF3800 domain-containing protein [Clostridium perfringens]|uniref:DUF3800 domain-containing protein n=1 Tax=Clostridium perfringens TaxID=1502 RepID=UPI000E1A51D2|nr:DUF3800 domain-containing protein [Clostridium perfringens]MDH5064833.1 hypothetical protein [Clostridium perfringens]MDU4024915.1 DUF3800 domain-containing protein [Clostridium perfringens]MDU4052128.1 DUF3800 domain-containing protein [Clostridium perfringens]TBX19189.1 hypothetical protein BFS06_16205 [Clostridium perfringens]SUY46388.1 Protein of uncharacterised function (DUF3800) [Clostridium perfringens]